MTALRTMWGIDLKYLEKQFGKERFKYLLYEADSFIKDGTLLSEFFHLRLSKEGKLISDYVISELMAI
jgi:oxygen-independent coproporphyrinogen-3 oxidase